MGAIGLRVKPLDVVNLWMPRQGIIRTKPLGPDLRFGWNQVWGLSQHPCWNMAAGLQMCLREDRLHIRASSYSPPCPWVLNQPFKTRSGKHNPSIVPVVDLMLRISNFGHHPYMMALNQVPYWKRYFAHSICSDQWLDSTAGSSQDDAYFSETSHSFL